MNYPTQEYSSASILLAFIIQIKSKIAYLITTSVCSIVCSILVSFTQSAIASLQETTLRVSYRQHLRIYQIYQYCLK
ncbi:hypothetical protein [Sphaerospermopsis aphanizomenoides]|jgi:hypothetical protein|uniref:hypothetical protein n=1 Tax=Sphaerospermopsis aphanizomenoides TaxID=459663 RepID=UPI001882AF60|nr:hypothetical protein [Sphaerospermopsis aphanizomenoides]